jgi:hypothetical protein
MKSFIWQSSLSFSHENKKIDQLKELAYHIQLQQHYKSNLYSLNEDDLIQGYACNHSFCGQT